MGLFDSVPRADFDALQGRYDALHEKYDKLVADVMRLKKKGYELPHESRPARVIQSGPTPEESAAKRMHDQLIDDLAKDLENMPGVPKAVAQAEAKRLREAALGASFGEPPV